MIWSKEETMSRQEIEEIQLARLKETVKLNDLSIDILYNDEIDHELEKENLFKEKDKLISSIERRKKLLSNENYVNKAPANVVENDRIQLEKEQLKLAVALDTNNYTYNIYTSEFAQKYKLDGIKMVLIN